MKRKETILCIFLVFAILALLILLYLRIGARSAGMSESEDSQAESASVMEKTEPLTSTLAIAGDIVCHTGLNETAYDGETGRYDYGFILAGATPWISAADYSVACMETTFTQSGTYSGYPIFVSPHGLAESLAASGFDLISTASNHSMDSARSGISSTLDVLDENGLSHVGTYRSQQEYDESKGVVVADVGGVSVAFLAFTYGTNGVPVTGFEYAVNIYAKDYLAGSGSIDYDALDEGLMAAKELDTDIISVFMHWGNEYATTPNEQQEELADYLFAQGVSIILGGHTHVPQPIELRDVTDEAGHKRTGLLIYSLGNFISCQNDAYTNLTAIVNVTFEKDQDTRETVISDVSYVPMFMLDTADHSIDSVQGGRYALLDLRAAMDAYESGGDAGQMNKTAYTAMEVGLEDIHSIMGGTLDGAGPTED